MQSLSNNQWHCPQYSTVILKVVWKNQRPWIAKTILRKNKQSQRKHICWLQIILQIYSKIALWCLHKKDTYINGTELRAQKYTHCLYGQLICNKGVKNIQWKKIQSFSKWCQENWTVMCKGMKFKHFLIPYKTNKLKMD